MVYDEEPKISPGQVLRSRRILVINAGVFLLLAWGFFGEWQSNRDLGQQVQAKVKEADQLQLALDDSTARMDQLAGAAAAEREARLKLNLQKPDEEVYVVRGLEDETARVAPEKAVQAAQPATPTGNAVTWWHYFFK
jgi:cell division protein FtsB